MAKAGLAGCINTRFSLRVALIGAAVLVVSHASIGKVDSPVQGWRAIAPASTARIPLYFEENRGQTAREVRFLARAGDYTAFLTGRETVISYRSPDAKYGRDAIIRMSLAGSTPPSSVRGAHRLAGIVNHLIGNDPSRWLTRIPTFAEVDYADVYPGIGMVYRGTGQDLEFDFRVAPSADPENIRMAITGASSIRVSDDGSLILNTVAGPVWFLKPMVYQEIAGERVSVEGSYHILAGGDVSFQVGKYNPGQWLVIDPAVLVVPSTAYSTYLGSAFGASFNSMAVDSSGNAYICGTTGSASFPLSSPAYQTTFPSNVTKVGFVTVLNATGTGIVYSTFISGTSLSTDNGTPVAIGVDANGHAFVGGTTSDSSFPVVNAFQSSIPALALAPAGSNHTVGIVFELAANGASLVYSSLLGGPDPYNAINAIAVDSAGNAYVTGTVHVYTNGGTGSHAAHFPTTRGVIWPPFNQNDLGAGFSDGFAAKISPPSGGNATLMYSTLIGDATTSPGLTFASGIAIDPGGNAYITGNSNGNIGDHGGTISTTFNMSGAPVGTGGVWVLELNPTASAAVYVDYLGGNQPKGAVTTVAGIKVDANGAAYLTGSTQTSNFQTTSGAYQATPVVAGVTSSVSMQVQSDVYVTVIAPGGGSLQYSTYLNGSTVSPAASIEGYDASSWVAGIVLGTGGQFAVAGQTADTNFPVVFPNITGGVGLMHTFPAGKDFANFIAKFASSGSLSYSTFVGAGGETGLNGVASSNGTDVYVIQPEPAQGLSTVGAWDAGNGTGAKQLVMRVTDPPAIPTTISVGSQTVLTGGAVQPVILTSTLSASAAVNAGLVSYTVTNSGNTQVGATVASAAVSDNSVPPTTFTLPANTPAGTYTINASYLGAASFLNSTGTGVLSVVVPNVTIAITTSPTGLSFSVNGTGCAPGSYTAPASLNWTPGSSCTITVISPQGTEVFLQWDDGTTNASRSLMAPSASTTYTATFGTAPVIKSNPANATAIAGSTATFIAAASGDPTPTVQWQVSTNGGATFSNVAGATSSTLNLTTTAAQNGSMYRAVFTNSIGPAATTAAALAVNFAPTISASPLSTTVSAGSTASFTAAATGNPAPAAQWQFSTNGGVTFSNVAGATSSTLSFAETAAQNGYQYRAVFTNLVASATSTAATLTVTAPLVTGFALSSPVLRNDFGGFVGMQFAVGSNPLLVNALGRVCVAGNSQTHLVKLVNAVAGNDVIGGSATVNMSGCTGGQFVYVNLASPITLKALASYYLMSEETTNGDQWYDLGGVSAKADVSVISAVYLDQADYIALGGANTSYVPPNMQYAVASAPVSTPPPAAASSGFVLTYNTNSQPLRNNFTGFVGMSLQTGATALSVSSVGRVCVAGNSQTHTVEFVNAAAGVGVPGGSATVNMAGCMGGQFVYEPLAASPLTLQANTTYYLVSAETSGGDQWYDQGTLATKSDATVLSSVWSNGASWTTAALNASYVPPNFIYTVGSNPAAATISVTVGTNISGPSFTVDGTSYTTPQTFTWTSGSSHTIATTAPQAAAGGSRWAFTSWSDAGSISHSVSPTSNTNYTAAFTMQYLLTTSVTGSGSISANPSSSDGYYNAGTSVQLAAAANAGNLFSGFTGDLGGAGNPQSVTMSAAHSVTANFQVIAGATGFLTSFALNSPPLRNNYTGFVGMTIQVGSNALNVISLGRICVAGNSGSHTVMIVNASTGTQLAGASVSVNMSGCTAGQFVIAPLASAAVLNAGGNYYVVSQESSGGDQWYDVGSVTAKSDASVVGPVYSIGASYVSMVNANMSYVPPDFQYTLQTASGPQPLVTSFNLSGAPLRNNFTGFVGMKLTGGTSNLSVSSLGRVCVAGNNGSHTVELVNAVTGTVIAGASVSVNMAGCPAGRFVYTALPSAVTLSSGTSFYLASQETSGGDQWYDSGTLTTTGAAQSNNSVYLYNGAWLPAGGADTSYVPANLLYQIAQ